jgi:hypothetical protein
LLAPQLYTDDEEVLFEAARPILLNGIEDSREASFLLSIDAACAVLTFDVPPTQAPLTRGFLCAREWPTETVVVHRDPTAWLGWEDSNSQMSF